MNSTIKTNNLDGLDGLDLRDLIDAIARLDVRDVATELKGLGVECAMLNDDGLEILHVDGLGDLAVYENDRATNYSHKTWGYKFESEIWNNSHKGEIEQWLCDAAEWSAKAR